MKLKLDRKELDIVLFDALRAVFQFERLKVQLFGISFQDIYLLQFLMRKSPARMGDIADEMKVPVSTLSRSIGRLEKRGLLSRKQDKGDKRIILVSLKAKGRKLVAAVEDHTFELVSRNLNQHAYTEEDLAAFVNTAKSLSILFSPNHG